MRIDTPATMIDRVDERLSELESRLTQMEVLQQLLLRLLSSMHPLSNVLAQYRANSTQEQELLQYLDQLAACVHSLERTRQPTVEEFRERMGEILPAQRKDIVFLRLVMDTLRVERGAYRELHDYMHAQGWPARIALRT